MALPTQTDPELDPNDVARGLSELENYANGPSDEEVQDGIQDAENYANAAGGGSGKDSNPYDSYYNNKFGHKGDGKHTDTHGDIVQDNYNADTPTEAIKKQEENPGSLFKSGEDATLPRSGQRWWSKFTKANGRGVASGSVIGLLVGGFGFSSVILAPASLLVTIEKNLTSRDSDSTRTNIAFRRAYVSKLFSKDKSRGNSKIEDKMTKMTPEQQARWTEEGFDVKLSPEGTIDDLKFPDGTDVTDGEQFNDHAENTPEGRRAVSDVLDVRSAFFDNQVFHDELADYKIEKSKRIQGSDEEDPAKRKEAIDKSFDENSHLTAEPDDTARLGALREDTVGENGSKLKGKVTEVTEKATKAANLALPVSIACATYNAARLTTATIKAKWVYELVSFAYPFVRAAAQIEDQGDIEPSVVENLANRLTWFNPDPKAPDFNHSALDSQGLKMAIYGDFTGLTEFTKQYTSWGWENAPAVINSVASGYVKTAQDLLGGKRNVKLICQGAHDAQAVGAIGCIANLPLCIVGLGAAYLVEHFLLPKIVEQLAKPALEYLSHIDLSSTLQGEGAGDALAAGMGLFLSTNSLANTVRPAGGTGAIQKVKNFIVKTDDMNYHYTTQLSLEDAKRNPWDVTNQYSFMGQIASMFNPYFSNDGTIFSRIANLTAVVNTSFARLPTTANALFSQPSNLTLQDPLSGDATANNLGKCFDPDMHDLDGVCDWSGRPVGYTSDNVLNGLNDIAVGNAASGSDLLTKSIDFMVHDKTTYQDPTTAIPKTVDGDIDPDTGETKPNSNFDNYVKYCIQRKNGDGEGTIPIGSSTGSIVEDSGNWFDGERCMGKDAKDQTMLDSFATYYNWCYVQYATAERKTDCIHDKDEANSTAASSTSNCGDGTTASIYKCALQFDPYTYQMGAGHPQYGTTSWYQSFKSSPPSDPNSLKFDCSSLVMASVVAAFGKDVPNMTAPGSFSGDPAHWQSVPKDQAQQGDVVVFPNHVEIINTNDPASQTFTTFGAHTDSAPVDVQIGPQHYSYNSVSVGTFRYVGPGVGSGTGNINV